jgi:hypothetical protein
MNKHILPYSEKINESIGRGSVLLIKGRPTKEGRFLYVTTINGYAEIKPGIKMVFIGDTIYRVIHKGGDKFAGRKVSYNGEDGLKGVFNMKNPGKPSVVLNHNKTPFHWITLKHLDIGKALREVGTRLFSHELILESNNEGSETSARSYVLGEVLKLVTGQASSLKLKGVHVDEGGEDIYDIEDDEGRIIDYVSEFELTLQGDLDNTPPEFVDYLSELGMFPTDFGLGVISDEDRKLLGLSNDTDGLLFNIRFETDASVRHSYDPGDHWTPPSSDSEVDDIDSRLAEDYPFTIEGDDINIPDDLQTEVEVYNEMIREQDPAEILGDLESLVHGKVKKSGSFQRDPKISSQLRLLYYNYMKALVNLKKNGLSEEDKKKWSKIDTINIDKLKSQINDIVKKQKELEEISKDPDQELTQEQIDTSKTFFDMINKMLPINGTAFNYRTLNQVHVSKIDLINTVAIDSAINALQRGISNPDKKKLELERELMNINYQKARDNALGKQHGTNLQLREAKLDFYLNPNT